MHACMHTYQGNNHTKKNDPTSKQSTMNRTQVGHNVGQKEDTDRQRKRSRIRANARTVLWEPRKKKRHGSMHDCRHSRHDDPTETDVTTAAMNIAAAMRYPSAMECSPAWANAFGLSPIHLMSWFKSTGESMPPTSVTNRMRPHRVYIPKRAECLNMSHIFTMPMTGRASSAALCPGRRLQRSSCCSGLLRPSFNSGVYHEKKMTDQEKGCEFQSGMGPGFNGGRSAPFPSGPSSFQKRSDMVGELCA